MSKILIADEDNDSRTALKEYLNSTRNFIVIESKDGSSVMKNINAFNPNAIILDLVLSGTDGFAILEEIKKLEEKPGP